MYGYCLRSILRDVVADRTLTQGQIEFVEEKLAKDVERANQQAIRRHIQKEGFKRKIMDVLEFAPTSGLPLRMFSFLLTALSSAALPPRKLPHICGK